MNNGNMPANVVTEEQWDRSSSAAPATGLTKREHFAAMAMQGLLHAGSDKDNFIETHGVSYVDASEAIQQMEMKRLSILSGIASRAVNMADALLNALEEKS